jgi:hypothetical protein
LNIQIEITLRMSGAGAVRVRGLCKWLFGCVDSAQTPLIIKNRIHHCFVGDISVNLRTLRSKCIEIGGEHA